MGVSFDLNLDDDDESEIHEINVTPFIDVMLVLLIIFMVAAPLSTVDLPVDLPSATAVPMKKPDNPIYVTIKADLVVAVGETPVMRAHLVHALEGMAEGHEQRIFLRADRGVPYGELMDVLELLRLGGYSKIALVALEGVPQTTPPAADQSGPSGGRQLEMTDFRPWHKVPMSMWTLAALGAVAIHLGCVALALAFIDREPDDQVGAPAVEIGIELLAPHTDMPDLPPGPDVDASIASPQTVDQAAVAEQADLPRAVPMETENPERLVAPVETDKPKDEPTAPAVPTIASVESVAVEATAPPSSEMIAESTRSVTPVQGIGVSAQRARATWQKELIAHFNRHKRYPTNRSAQTAEILVGFELDQTGRVLSSSIVQGSGDASFDEAALAMIRRSDPVPTPPLAVAQEGLSFTLPVIFRARHGG